MVWNAAIPESVNQLNQRLLAWTNREPSLRVIDLFSLAGLQPGTETYQDTLHLRPEAYARLTQVLTNELYWSSVANP